jgi:hypothetical protein
MGSTYVVLLSRGRSKHHPPAVDLNELAGDERRSVTGQEHHQMTEVLGSTPSLVALSGEDFPIVVLQIGMNLLGIAREGPRGEGIDR